MLVDVFFYLLVLVISRVVLLTRLLELIEGRPALVMKENNADVAGAGAPPPECSQPSAAINSEGLQQQVLPCRRVQPPSSLTTSPPQSLPAWAPLNTPD